MTLTKALDYFNIFPQFLAYNASTGQRPDDNDDRDVEWLNKLLSKPVRPLKPLAWLLRTLASFGSKSDFSTVVNVLDYSFDVFFLFLRAACRCDWGNSSCNDGGECLIAGCRVVLLTSSAPTR